MNILNAVIASFAAALALIFTFIPKLIGFLVILLIGWIVASAISKAVTFLLKKVGFDRLSQRIGLDQMSQRAGISLDAAGILGKVVYWFIFLIFLVPAVDTLGISAVSNILNQIIAYIPNVFVAILILLIGAFVATIAADVVRGGASSARLGNASLLANIVRYAILGFVALIALEQLGIAPALLNILFTAVVGAAALAAGLAFGLGGQDTARKYLDRTESAASTAAAQLQAQQSTASAQAQQSANRAQQTLPSSRPDVPRAR